MVHITVFCYIFTILIGVSALTIQWLAGKGDKGKNFAIMKPFIVMLLIMNIYDFVLYYHDNIIREHLTAGRGQGDLLLSLGDALMAVLVLLWLRVQKNMCREGRFDLLVNAGRRYLAVYLLIFVVAVVFFRQQYWIRLMIDIPLIGLLLAGGGAFLCDDIKRKRRKKFIVYKSVITVFLLINYVTYFISESGFLEESESLLDVTIFFWLVINIANIVLLYKRDFYESYLTAPKESAGVVDLREALEEVRRKFELTKREMEILEQLYAGKTNTQIADELFISASTVKAHIYNLFRKLRVKSRGEAVCVVREVRETESKSEKE